MAIGKSVIGCTLATCLFAFECWLAAGYLLVVVHDKSCIKAVTDVLAFQSGHCVCAGTKLSRSWGLRSSQSLLTLKRSCTACKATSGSLSATWALGEWPRQLASLQWIAAADPTTTHQLQVAAVPLAAAVQIISECVSLCAAQPVRSL